MQVFRDLQKYAYITSLVCIFLPGIACSMMLPLSTEELKAQSDVILRGTVENVTGQWSRDHMVIVSHVEVCVHDIYKGALDKSLVTSKEVVPGTLYQDFITVEFDGGAIDDLEFGVSDMPRFQKDEEVILFLAVEPSRVKDTIYKLVGSAQGKYIIDDGLVKKEGFTVLLEKEEDKVLVDNHIPVEELVEKIDENRDAFIHIDRTETKGNGHENGS